MMGEPENITKENAMSETTPQRGATPEHGARGYWRGCRCRACAEANRAYQRDARKAARLRFLADPSRYNHGSVRTYLWGCRCDECAAGYRIAQARRPRHPIPKSRFYDLGAFTAANRTKAWTGPELEFITVRREDGRYVHTATAAARALGRSRHAVGKMRWKCVHEPKFSRLAGLPPG